MSANIDPLALIRCPFCGGEEIHATCADDDDTFIKTASATCGDCACRMEARVDWRPFSANRDFPAFEAAWKAAIAAVWNRRA